MDADHCCDRCDDWHVASRVARRETWAAHCLWIAVCDVDCFGSVSLSVSQRLRRLVAVRELRCWSLHGLVLWLAAALFARVVSDRVRATCQGFGFNFGRILAAIGTLQMASLQKQLSGFTTMAGESGGVPVACSFLTLFYVLGIALIFFAPETKGKPLPQ